MATILKNFLILLKLSIGLLVMGACAPKTYISNASACLIPFDYGDEGVNAQNARALLVHYCLCKDEKACE